jgi:Domain of unknown function (DUF5668)
MDERDYGREFKDKLKQEIHERIHRSVHEQINQTVSRPRVMLLGHARWGFAWGFIIVLVGAALLLHHLGVIPFDPVARFWPLIFVVFGIMNLTTHSRRFFEKQELTFSLRSEAAIDCVRGYWFPALPIWPGFSVPSCQSFSAVQTSFPSDIAGRSGIHQRG